LKAAVLAAEASAILVRKSEDELKPELDLEARAGFAGSDPDYSESTANVFAETDLSWKIGLTFSVPLGGHSAKGSDQAARAELAKARTSIRMIEQEIARSSREALRNLRLSLKSIEASEKTSLALAKRLEAEQHKFAAGLATTLDVLEAQESYAQALAGRKRAIIDHVLARAELQREIGQLNN
jgi:outer membrane protein TolC